MAQGLCGESSASTALTAGLVPTHGRASSGWVAGPYRPR
jgi:hypothetical protein